MSTSASVSVRLELLKWALILYAISILISMAAMSIAAVILIFTILVSSSSFHNLKQEFISEIRKPRSKSYLLCSLVLALACITSLVFAIVYPLEYGGRQADIHFFKTNAKIWYFFWPLLLVIGLRRIKEADRKVVLKSWIIAFVILSVLGMIQFFVGWPRPQGIPTQPGFYHATLFLGHHLSVASIFIFPFFVCLDRFYYFWKETENKRSTLFYAFAAGAGLITLFLTYSRTLWAGLAVGLALWILFTLRKRARTIVLSAFIIGLLSASLFPPIQKRIHDSMGIHTRLDLWEANLEFFRQRPITGVGWRQNQELSGYYLMDKYHTNDVFSGHAHNNVLDIIGSMGMFGLVSWVLWCGSIFWILFQRRDQAPHFSKGLICAWIVFLINGLTQVNFWEGKVEHQMAWVIAWALL